MFEEEQGGQTPEEEGRGQGQDGKLREETRGAAQESQGVRGENFSSYGNGSQQRV